MAKAFYLLVTFLESILAIFGIRAPFEQSAYRVVGTLASGVEIRSYGPLVAVETRADGGGFGRLFAYIAGANGRDQLISMTAPVEDRGGPFGQAAASPSDVAGEPVLRFILPRAVVANPPLPKDASVRIANLPARTVAALRFSGWLDQASIQRNAARLTSALAAAHRTAAGPLYVLGYDPPFTIPFLRRNEVAVDLLP